MHIVGIGGTLRKDSSSEVALRAALVATRELGATTDCFSAARLNLPMYDPTVAVQPPLAIELITAIRIADGIILSSPSYHGTVSGLVKNALDYIEETVADSRPYFYGLPVGCIAVAQGWQGAASALRTLRDITHSLRGFPTPYGATINTAGDPGPGGGCLNDGSQVALYRVGMQVAELTSVLEGCSAKKF